MSSGDAKFRYLVLRALAAIIMGLFSNCKGLTSELEQEAEIYWRMI